MISHGTRRKYDEGSVCVRERVKEREPVEQELIVNMPRGNHTLSVRDGKMNQCFSAVKINETR